MGKVTLSETKFRAEWFEEVIPNSDRAFGVTRRAFTQSNSVSSASFRINEDCFKIDEEAMTVNSLPTNLFKDLRYGGFLVGGAALKALAVIFLERSGKHIIE